jgi:hypothetical protein
VLSTQKTSQRKSVVSPKISRRKSVVDCRWRALPSNQRRQAFCWSVSSLETATPSESPLGYRHAEVRPNCTTGLAGSACVTAVVPHVEAWPRPGQGVSIRLSSELTAAVEPTDSTSPTPTLSTGFSPVPIRYTSHPYHTGIFLFSTAFKSILGPVQSLICWVPGAMSLRVKWPECEADHTTQCRAGVKNVWSLIKHRKNFTLISHNKLTQY